MKKLLTVTALLLALVLCLCPAFGALAQMADVDGETVGDAVEGTEVSNDIDPVRASMANNLYEVLIASTTLTEMDNLLLSYYEIDATVYEWFGAVQIAALDAHANTLYANAEDQAAEEDVYQNVMASLAALFGEYDAAVYAADGTTIYFDITKDNVIFSGNNYSGYVTKIEQVTNGQTTTTTVNAKQTKAHDNAYVYVIQGNGTRTSNYVTIGTKEVGEDPVNVTKDYTIYLDKVNIRRSGANQCAFYVASSANHTVSVILKDGTTNYLYSGKGRAGLEKSWNQCTLVVACEKGYEAWKNNHKTGHTACSSCGRLYAKSGNAWTGSEDAETYAAGAGIGTAGWGDESITSGGSFTSNRINNRLWNLTIAGGRIHAQGAWGTGGSGDNKDASGGGAAIGTGASADQTITACDIRNLNITGGIIYAYRGDNSAACIGGGYRSGDVTINIYGGNIKAGKDQVVIDDADKSINNRVVRLRAAAIGAGGGGTSSPCEGTATVNIHGGTIDAYGQYGAAIGGGAGGASGQARSAIVNIYGGTITAVTEKGHGAAIGTGGSLGDGRGGDATVTIDGGTITATSENGADIGGGGTNGTEKENVGGKGTVTIKQGTVTANNGGIGGGQANNADGGDAVITISGGNVTAKSVGGGLSKKAYGGDCTLSITGGTIDVDNDAGASIGGGTGYTKGGDATVNISAGTLTTGSIGGGLATKSGAPIGSANVTISGGNIQGQVVMAAGATTPCSFTMTGGTIDNVSAKSNGYYFIRADGGAAYVENGTATMSGGTIKNTTANKGGAFYVTGGNFEMSGTAKIQDATATTVGGAVAVEKGTVTINGGTIDSSTAPVGGAVHVKGSNNTTVYFTMTGGTLSNNTATTDGGGAVYVDTGSVKMENGTMTANSAVNGGAVYVHGGAFNMDNGTITSNTATVNGGAVYMSGGNFTMKNGQINSNEANNGGAVYMASTNAVLTMTSGTMKENKALLNKAQSDLDLAGGDGGAIFAMGGTLYIGVKDCPGGEHVHDDGLSHPVITENKAEDCGGGISISKQSDTSYGVVHLYCCDATDNLALYKGTGKNIFMDGGHIYLYTGAEIGLAHDPDLVIIGGELHNMITDKNMVTINYYENQGASQVTLHGLVEAGQIVNLPDAEYFIDNPPAGKTFVGWTTQGGGSLNVRDKSDYEGSGMPYEIKGDGTDNPVMNLYAVWMPSNYKITFVDDMERTEISQEHLPTGYTLTKDEATLTINAPTKPGYAVIGYYIYQDLGQDANWGDVYEPVYDPVTGPFIPANLDLEHNDFQDVQKITLDAPGASYVLDTGDMKFGDITLVAIFEAQFASMRITKMPEMAEGNFIFHIVGDSLDSDIPDVDMYVTAKAGENNAVLITELPVGSYTVTEQTDWSWRYGTVTSVSPDNAKGMESVNVTIDNPAQTEEVTFTNTKDNHLWLDAEDAEHNELGVTAPVVTGAPASN